MHVSRLNTFFTAMLHVLWTTTFYRIQNEFENAELYDLQISIVIGYFALLESFVRVDRFVNRFITQLLDRIIKMFLYEYLQDSIYYR